MTKVLSSDEFATVMREWYERNYGGFTRAARGDYNGTVTLVTKWIARGDRAAVYRNADLGHPDLGQIVCVSFGSAEAQVPTKPCEACGGSGGERHASAPTGYVLCHDCFGMGWEAPPTSLPVDGSFGLGWRYQLESVFDGLTEEVSLDDAPEDEAYDEVSTHDGGEC